MWESGKELQKSQSKYGKQQKEVEWAKMTLERLVLIEGVDG